MAANRDRESPSYIASLARHREDYECQKSQRAQKTRELQRQREEIMKERERLLALRSQDGSHDQRGGHRSPDSGRLSSALTRAKSKIPDFSQNLHHLKLAQERRKRYLTEPYRGELGAGSYEPWQLEDFYFVREFVSTWIEEVLDFIVKESPDKLQERTKKALAKFRADLEAEQAYAQLNREVAEVEKSITEELIHEELVEISDESLQLCTKIQHMTDCVILEAVLEPGNNSSLVSDAYKQMKKDREKRGGVWVHTQRFQFYGNVGDVESQAPGEVDEFGGIILDFHDIKPSSDVPGSKLTHEFLSYRTEESQYWAKISPVVTTMPLAKRTQGFSCSALSPDHSLIALGSVQGDIFVWDLMVYPPRIIRSTRGKATVVELQWSFDLSKLLSLTEQGTVQLWSLKDTTSALNDVKPFEPAEENLGFKPTALVNILTLASKDLHFTEGPLVGSGDLIKKAVSISFHPSMTLLGKQPAFLVGLENGTILKIHEAGKDNEAIRSFPKVAAQNGVQHKIGKGLEAELFKAHSNLIISINFLQNCSTMITTDSKGFINLWEYKETSLSGFGWFVPMQQYRLDLSEQTYEPAPGVQKEVHFTDVVKGTGRRAALRREDMVKNRRETQTQINSLHLGKPWMKEEGDETVMHVYAPKHVPESGATFHCIQYYKTGLLASYTTQLYKPCKVPCSRLLSCKPNPAGTKLVFMLLFPEVNPRGSYVTFVVLNLTDMALCQNRVILDLSPEEHNRCERQDLCSFSITKALDATASEYAVYNINGRVGAFSLNSGNIVMTKGQGHWVGCHIVLKESDLIPSSKLEVASTPKGLSIICYTAGKNSASMVDLVDKNSPGQRLRVWRAFRKWQQTTKEKREITTGQRLRRLEWTFSGNTAPHVECAIQSMILDLADIAIQLVNGPFDKAKQTAFITENRKLPYEWKAAQILGEGQQTNVL